MTRSRRQQNQVEAKVKTWLKRHDPAYLEKVVKNNSDDSLKDKRNKLSRIRRAGQAAMQVIFKKCGPLKDNSGHTYEWNSKFKCLCRNDTDVVRRARDGTIHYIPYEEEEELDDDKYHEPIVSDTDKEIRENVEKLLNGEHEQLETKLKKRKIVVTQDLSDEDLYWKNLTEKQKLKLISKLKSKNVK